MRLSRSLEEFELSLVNVNEGRNWFKIFCWSTHIAEQHLSLSFRQFLLMIYLIKGLFGGPSEQFGGLGSGSKTVLGSTQTVQQLLFSVSLNSDI